MASRTVGGLIGGVAHGGYIHRENYEFTSVEEPAPMSAFRHALDLRFGDLDPMVYGGRTLGTTLSGSIPKSTYIGGTVPSLITNHGQVFSLGSQKSMAQKELTQGMASSGHILLGNHEVIRTNGSTPITSSYPT